MQIDTYYIFELFWVTNKKLGQNEAWGERDLYNNRPAFSLC